MQPSTVISQVRRPLLTQCRAAMSLCLQVLFAAQEEPQLRPLILRRFKQDGDVTKVGTSVWPAGASGSLRIE